MNWRVTFKIQMNIELTISGKCNSILHHHAAHHCLHQATAGGQEEVKRTNHNNDRAGEENLKNYIFWIKSPWRFVMKGSWLCTEVVSQQCWVFQSPTLFISTLSMDWKEWLGLPTKLLSRIYFLLVQQASNALDFSADFIIINQWRMHQCTSDQPIMGSQLSFEDGRT